MVNILFKKSFLHKSLIQIEFDDLWNTNGIFTTMRLIGKNKKILFFKEHIDNLNKSLNIFNVKFILDKKVFNILIKNLLLDNYKYDHLIRIAVNISKISISLRKRQKNNINFYGKIVNYQRPKPAFKHLNYKKVISFLDRINTKKTEIMFVKNGKVYEGATTNFIFVKNKKLYIPRNGYYYGTTLKFFVRNSIRKFLMKNILLDDLESYDEILIVGSGKGVLSLCSIPQIKWNKKSNLIFNEFNKLFNSYIYR